jgi:uncharacterized protein (DUF488 family)
MKTATGSSRENSQQSRKKIEYRSPGDSYAGVSRSSGQKKRQDATMEVVGMKLFTIGFTKKTAEQFFSTLSSANVKTLIDVRLNNVSQLAGFSKRKDLQYFLRVICGVEYLHLPELAPTPEILDEYRNRSHDWRDYEAQFLSLLRKRKVAQTLDRKVFDRACLLCSEDKPSQCHRRLVAEHLQKKWAGIEITHL